MRLMPRIAEDIHDATADILALAQKLNGDHLLDFTKKPPKKLQNGAVKAVMEQSARIACSSRCRLGSGLRYGEAVVPAQVDFCWWR